MSDPLPASRDSGTFDPSPRPKERVAVILGAYWHPAGLWGLLYWYAHRPLYGPLVHGAVEEIVRRAERLDDEGPARRADRTVRRVT